MHGGRDPVARRQGQRPQFTRNRQLLRRKEARNLRPRGQGPPGHPREVLRSDGELHVVQERPDFEALLLKGHRHIVGEFHVEVRVCGRVRWRPLQLAHRFVRNIRCERNQK